VCLCKAKLQNDRKLKIPQHVDSNFPAKLLSNG